MISLRTSNNETSRNKGGAGGLRGLSSLRRLTFGGSLRRSGASRRSSLSSSSSSSLSSIEMAHKPSVSTNPTPSVAVTNWPNPQTTDETTPVGQKPRPHHEQPPEVEESSSSSALSDETTSTIEVSDKPRMTFYHKTNEMVLRDTHKDICAIIVGPAKKHMLRNFFIYGFQPMYPDQEPVKGLKLSDKTLQLLKVDTSDNLGLYEWAEFRARHVGTIFKTSKQLTLQLATKATDPDTTASTTSTTTTADETLKTAPTSFIMKDYKSSNRDLVNVKNRPFAPSTTMRLDHSMVANVSTTFPGSRALAISPDMDPMLCVFFLACAEEFVEYLF